MDGLLLDLLDGPSRDAVVSRLRTRSWRKGDVVFNDGDEGDSFYLVVSGRFDVRASTPDGAVVVLRLIQSGEFFGELALMGSGNRRLGRVTALEPARTQALHSRDFDELRRLSPAVDRFLLEALAERLRETTDQVLDLLMPTEVRVHRRLHALAASYGVGEPIHLTQDDLARMTGTTRQTVNRVLRKAEADGAVRLSRGALTILDPGRLGG